MLNEYSFYVPEGDDPEGEINDLLLSEEDPEEEPEEAPEGEPDLDGLEAELDGDSGDVADPEMEGDPVDDMGDEPIIDEPSDDMGEEPMMDEPQEDEVELDVTELVASTDEATQAAADANDKVDQLMGMVSKLEAQLSDVNSIGSKIDNLENELEKRSPTPEEKIEMRSLDSYPYNLKLTDFWKTQEGKYDVLGNDENEGKPEEYTLTKDDIESDYSESSVKSSLDSMEDDEYEEEEI